MAKLTDKPVYKLGRLKFSVKNCDPTFAQSLKELLPPGQCENDETTKVVDVATGCNNDFDALFGYMRERHRDCLWIDAACLKSPRGQLVLLAGASNTGKSTTALALALGYGWSVLAEDVTLIDLKQNKILSFLTPFSIKDGTLQLLNNTIGRAPASLIKEQWVAMGEMGCTDNYDLDFNLAILLLDLAKEELSFEVAAISPQTFVRMILSRSNILRIHGSADQLAGSLSTGTCYSLKGGSLQERINFIFEQLGSLGANQQ
jgi:hypothetical protein